MEGNRINMGRRAYIIFMTTLKEDHFEELAYHRECLADLDNKRSDEYLYHEMMISYHELNIDTMIGFLDIYTKRG